MSEYLTDTIKEQAVLYVLEALDFDELRAFKVELSSNRELADYVKELEKTIRFTDPLQEMDVDETWLQSQRNLLRAKIAEHPQITTGLFRSTGQHIRHYIDVLFIPKKPSLAIATYALLAFLAGRYLIPGVSVPEKSGINVRELIQSGLLSQADIQFNSDQQHPISVALNTRQKVELSGNINDEEIRELVSYLLLNDQNPGNRLKAAELVQEMNPDDDVKMVLVSSALSDPNPGIRLRSIRLLQSYPVDPLLINACQKILMEDTNEAVRMEAIAILAKQPSRKLQPILRLVAATDANPYIQTQARELLYNLNNPMGMDNPGENP